MTNAFDTTGPSRVKLRQKTTKQMAKDATRENKEAPLCAFIPPEKAQKIRKAAI
jgi:hypothetical protein